jgi:hypothetical protein
MTVNLPRNASFAGYPLSKAREVIKFYESGHGPSVFELSQRSSISMSPFAVAGILQDFADAGFLERDRNVDFGHSRFRHKLTTSGASIAHASAAKRTSKAKAGAVLEGLLDRCQSFNDDKRAIETVDRVWVFGSMINPDKLDVGDIDFVLETGRRPNFPKGTEAADALLHKKYPEHIHREWSAYHEEWSVDRVRNQEIFGKRRHHLLASNDIYTLKALHQPCQLVFDRSRGGRVDDPVLPHHPDSTGREDWIKPRLSMPSLDLATFQPADVRWLGYYVYPTDDHSFAILADEADCRDEQVPVIPGLDGRHVFGMLVTSSTGKKTCVTINRNHVSIPDGPEFLVVTISPTDVLRGFDAETQSVLVKQARRCALVDVVRLAARRNDASQAHSIHVDLTYDGVPMPTWNIGQQDRWESTAVSSDMQFSILVSENGKRAPSYADVSQFDDEAWRKYGGYVGITQEEYERRVGVDEPNVTLSQQ